MKARSTGVTVLFVACLITMLASAAEASPLGKTLKRARVSFRETRHEAQQLWSVAGGVADMLGGNRVHQIIGFMATGSQRLIKAGNEQLSRGRSWYEHHRGRPTTKLDRADRREAIGDMVAGATKTGLGRLGKWLVDTAGRRYLRAHPVQDHPTDDWLRRQGRPKKRGQKD